jgi:hypothetical protein
VPCGRVLPRTLGSETARAVGHETLTVLSANVELGGADPSALIALVDRYHPDLLSVQELTHFLFRMPRATIALPDGRRLHVVAVHPQPPNMSFDRWREALQSLPAPGGSVPWALIGDFNATFDQAEFRDIVDGGYRDAGEATGKGLEPTWPSDKVFPWGLITIDHVLVDSRLGVAEYGVEALPGSDHRAIQAQLVLP